MFNLKQAVADWRARMAWTPALTAADIDELEAHLWEQVEALVEGGYTEQEAFAEASLRLGTAPVLGYEYQQERWHETVSAASLWRPIMVKNYLIIALRHMRRHKGYTFINVVGLALGLAVCTLAVFFIHDEQQYDRFHERAERIYRVHMDYEAEGTEERSASAPFPVGPTLRDTYAGVEEVTRLFRMETQIFAYEDQSFIEDLFFTDPTFFDIFSFELVQGDPATALQARNSIILTQTTARRYFGDEDPIGKVMLHENQHPFTVTGVIADFPEQSHIQFDMVAPVEWIRAFWRGPNPNGWDFEKIWTWNPAWTYIRLTDPAQALPIAEQLPDFVERHFADKLPGTVQLSLIPLTDIHLGGNRENEIQPNSSQQTVYIVLVMALLIVLVACINFMNLATARSARRAREIGMRKVLGARRSSLVRQFMGEAALMTALAMGCAFLLVWGALPAFNGLTGKTLALTEYSVASFMVGALGFLLCVSLIAGAYPAFVMSALKPVRALKGSLTGIGGHRGLRQGLVIAQFTVSVVLLVSIGVMQQQLRYIQDKNLGFEDDQILIIDSQTPTNSYFYTYKAQIEQHPKVVAVTAAGLSWPGRRAINVQVKPEGADASASRLVHRMIVDYDMAEVMDLELVEGRFFSEDFPADLNQTFVLNEAAVRQLGWDGQAIGQRLQHNSRVGEVIGVVKDFHLESLHKSVAPLMMDVQTPDWFNHFVIKLRPEDMPETIAFLEETWAALAPGYILNYTFMDADIGAYYASEERLRLMVGYLTTLALVIACLGLFGLAAFMAEQRTKEIGVRKALGASLTSILLLFSQSFTRLVLVAFVLGVPLSYFAMERWLSDFAYRINMGVTTFVWAGGLAVLVALLAVGYQAIRAARTNPVDALRYE